MRKLTVLSMLGVGRTDADGKRVTLFRFFRMLGGPGVFLALGSLGLLVGSTLAIIL